MNPVLQKIEAAQMAQATKKIPELAAGDTVKVNVKVVEGNRERVQAYEGVVIAIKNAGMNSSFTVRKISYGEGVERVFPTFSPRIESVELVRRGQVRRAKLYYLRDRRGKSARIAEKVSTPAERAAKMAETAANKANAKAEKAAAKSE